jgi:hypothetical protein
MIVKVEIPPRSGHAVVYDDAGAFMICVPLTPPLLARMAGSTSKRFRAQFDSGDRGDQCLHLEDAV